MANLELKLEMERKQYILKVLPQLKEETHCNDDLLDVMVSCGVFNTTDKQEIKSKATPNSQNSEFYGILRRKSKDDYAKTIQALKRCGQSTAAQILEHYSESNIPGNTLVSDNDVPKIANILSADATAVQKKEQIYSSLDIPRAELDALNKKVYLDNTGANGFFCVMLDKLKSRGGTMDKLIQCLNELKLVAAADKIREYNSLSNNKAHTSGTGEKISAEDRPTVPTKAVKPPSTLAKYVIKKCYKTLTRDLNADSLLTDLQFRDVISQSEKENVKDLASVDNRTKLLHIMNTKDRESVEDFIEIIKEEITGNSNIWKELEAAKDEFLDKYPGAI